MEKLLKGKFVVFNFRVNDEVYYGIRGKVSLIKDNLFSITNVSLLKPGIGPIEQNDKIINTKTETLVDITIE